MKRLWSSLLSSQVALGDRVVPGRKVGNECGFGQPPGRSMRLASRMALQLHCIEAFRSKLRKLQRGAGDGGIQGFLGFALFLALQLKIVCG